MIFSKTFAIIRVNDWISKEEKKAPKYEAPSKKDRSRVLKVDTGTGQGVRPKKQSMRRSPSKLPSHKAGKTLSTVQREKLQRCVPVPQLHPQSVPRDLHKLVDKKVRTEGVRKVSKGKSKDKKVVKRRVRGDVSKVRKPAIDHPWRLAYNRIKKHKGHS